MRVGDGLRDYPVLVGAGVLGTLGEELRRRAPGVRRWAVVSDEHVGPLYGSRVEEALGGPASGTVRITIPPGEGEKTRTRWGWITDRLLEAGVGGDLTGFVAATYMGGVPVVQIPTSLLAMVDASVGGKTGVDTRYGKNLVGAFHPPRAVIVDPEVIGTLPPGERRQGLAEALKHGAILDAEYGDWISGQAEVLLDGDPDAVLRLVRRSVELKAGVVSRDEREAGVREILNFGHTVAHALEHVTDYRIPHGSAVAMGMVWEAALGEAEGVTEPGTARRIVDWLSAVGLPTHPGPDLDPESGFRSPGVASRLEEGLLRDKKVRDGSPRVVLLRRCGEVARSADGSWARPLPAERILGPRSLLPD